MGRAARALVLHELFERTRDRWVLLVTGLLVLLSGGIALYGRSAEEAQAAVTAPSLVTLAAFLVPLIALVLGHDAIAGERERHTLGLLLSLPAGRAEVVLAKFLGRAVALALAISCGIGVAAVMLQPGHRAELLVLLPRTLLLGLAFLAVGVAVSVFARRLSTAASMVVVIWFLLVLFYDLGLLGVLVATGGGVSPAALGWAVCLNPAGLYRASMLGSLVGPEGLSEMGILGAVPPPPVRAAIWAAWIVLPLGAAAVSLSRRRSVLS